MGILGIDLNNICLDDTNYDEDNLETIIHIKFLVWHIKFEKRKALKKNKWRINAASVAPKGWWNFCISED